MNYSRDIIIARFFPDWKNWKEDWQEWRRQSEKNGNTVVLIPARSGSTRVKDKNIRDLCGKPLIAYTALMARALRDVDRIIVSTDSRKYCDIAEQWGAETPFLRPDDFSGTQTSLLWTYYHLLCFTAYTRYPVKTVITLAPTNPFRNLTRMQEMVGKTHKHGMCNSVFRSQTGGIETLDQDGRVLFKTLGQFNGRHVSNALISDNQLVFITNPIELIDIDTDEDLALAESVIENNLYDFGIAM